METKTEDILNNIVAINLQLLKNLIKIIKVNQKEVRRLKNNLERDSEFWDFHNGGIAFGNVIINEINKEIKQLQKEV